MWVGSALVSCGVEAEVYLRAEVITWTVSRGRSKSSGIGPAAVPHTSPLFQKHDAKSLLRRNIVGPDSPRHPWTADR